MSWDQKLGHGAVSGRSLQTREPIYFNEAQTHDKKLNYLFQFYNKKKKRKKRESLCRAMGRI